MESALRRDALTETYFDLENLIYDCVWRFREKYGGDFESLLAEANLLYVVAFDSYNETKGALSTWVYFCIKKGLLDFIKRRRQVNRYGVAFCASKSCYKAACKVAGKSYHHFYLSEILEEVSQDTKVLIKLVLHPPEAVTTEDLEKGFSPYGSRVYLKRYLHHRLGWTTRQIKESFKEIRKVISN